MPRISKREAQRREKISRGLERYWRERRREEKRRDRARAARKGWERRREREFTEALKRAIAKEERRREAAKEERRRARAKEERRKERAREERREREAKKRRKEEERREAISETLKETHEARRTESFTLEFDLKQTDLPTILAELVDRLVAVPEKGPVIVFTIQYQPRGEALQTHVIPAFNMMTWPVPEYRELWKRWLKGESVPSISLQTIHQLIFGALKNIDADIRRAPERFYKKRRFVWDPAIQRYRFRRPQDDVWDKEKRREAEERLEDFEVLRLIVEVEWR
jgi:hypothetical protein